MIVVVLDTNTLVSGFGWSGASSVIVDTVLVGEVLLVSSPPLLYELDRVLRYPKLAAVFANPDLIMERVRTVVDIVEPSIPLSVVADEPDNRVLEAAAEARVDAIVSGDAGLLALGSHDDIPILSAGEFVRRYLSADERWVSVASASPATQSQRSHSASSVVSKPVVNRW